MSVTSLHLFQGLIQRIYHWGASKLMQIFLPDMCETDLNVVFMRNILMSTTQPFSFSDFFSEASCKFLLHVCMPNPNMKVKGLK